MAITPPINVTVKIYSITGALVASFYSDTVRGENLEVTCSELFNGGLDKFSFTIPSDNVEPLFNDMECRIYVDGVWWYSGYAKFLPTKDTIEPLIEIEGKGFVHKLKEKKINVSYTAQTIDYIIKDIANTYLGTDINVYYNVSKIDTVTIPSMDIEFNDKSLFEIFESLNVISNNEYDTDKRTWGVDEEKELYFSAVSEESLQHLFEGYNYQDPKVDKVQNIVNKILTYRTTLADEKATEYVATYEDTNSQGLYGLFQKKLTFPDYTDTPTISKICDAILKKYPAPSDRVEIENLEVNNKLAIGFYELSNRRSNYFVIVNDMEDIDDWDQSGLSINTNVSLSTEEVFTGRKSLKMNSIGLGSGDYVEYTLPIPIQFPTLFRSFVFLTDTVTEITISVIDTNNNIKNLTFGGVDDEWFKRITELAIEGETGTMILDDSVLGTDDMLLDDSVLGTDDLLVDDIPLGGVINIQKIRITLDTDFATGIYIDSMSANANTYLHRKLLIEEIKYTLNRSKLAEVSFGAKPDSLIDEIDNNVIDGNIALSIYSKQ